LHVNQVSRFTLCGSAFSTAMCRILIGGETRTRSAAAYVIKQEMSS